MHRLGEHVRGNIVGYVALFVALGGVSYAALGPNSVGTRQLKSNAVISSKVKDASLRKSDFAPGQLPRGATGPQGPRGVGAPGATGATGPTGAGSPEPPPTPYEPYPGSFVMQIGDEVLPLVSFAGCYEKQLGIEIADCHFAMSVVSPAVKDWYEDMIECGGAPGLCPSPGLDQFRSFSVLWVHGADDEVVRALDVGDAYLSEFRLRDLPGSGIQDRTIRFVATPERVAWDMTPSPIGPLTSLASLEDGLRWRLGGCGDRDEVTALNWRTVFEEVPVGGGFAPGPPTFDDLTIEIRDDTDSTESFEFWENWAQNVRGGSDDRRDCLAILYDEGGHELARFEFLGMQPISGLTAFPNATRSRAMTFEVLAARPQ